MNKKGEALEADRHELEELLVAHMRRLMSDVRSLTLAQWPEVELTMAQARALVFLSQGIKRMKDVSVHLRSGMPSATSMVNRLVNKELVQRIKDEADRRVVAIELTPKGEEVVDRLLRMGRMRYEALAAALTDEEISAAIPVLEMLSQAARRHGSPAAPESGSQPAEAVPAQLE